MESLPSLGSLGKDIPRDVADLLRKTAVLKLNGGLGTSMGLEKAKSLLPVKDGKTFLDLIAEQIKHMRAEFKSKVRFVLMNSFSTSEDTRAFLKEHHPDLLEERDVELMQNSSCKVDMKTLRPASYPQNPEMEWYASVLAPASVSLLRHPLGRTSMTSRDNNDHVDDVGHRRGTEIFTHLWLEAACWRDSWPMALSMCLYQTLTIWVRPWTCNYCLTLPILGIHL